jgi:hypothetical protein
MISKIIQYKERLENLKNNHLQIDKSILCKILVMVNIAEMLIHANIYIDDSDKKYFEGQVAVGRYFCDWNEDWVAEEYFEVVKYIKENNWK